MSWDRDSNLGQPEEKHIKGRNNRHTSPSLHPMSGKHSAREAGIDDSDDAATATGKQLKQGVVTCHTIVDLALTTHSAATTDKRNAVRLKRFNSKYKPDINSDKVVHSMCGTLLYLL